MTASDFKCSIVCVFLNEGPEYFDGSGCESHFDTLLLERKQCYFPNIHIEKVLIYFNANSALLHHLYIYIYIHKCIYFYVQLQPSLKYSFET